MESLGGLEQNRKKLLQHLPQHIPDLQLGGIQWRMRLVTRS